METQKKTFASVKLEASKIPMWVVRDLFMGKDVSLAVSESKILSEGAPKYSDVGIAIWIRESKYQD